MSNWINVKDKLPDIKEHIGVDIEYQDVLVLDSDQQMYVAYLTKRGISGFRTVEQYSWEERSTGCGCCAKPLTPTHWMPLPELPNIEIGSK